MSALAFCRNRRLLAAADYSAVFADAQYRVSTSNLLILARPGKQTEARLGLVIAKKHVRLAVKRNRIKRVLREVFRHQQKALEGVDIIVLARSGLDRLTSDQQTKLVKKSFTQLIKKVTDKAPG